MEVKENALLSSLTTIGLGGEAKYFVSATTSEDLKDALLFAREKNVPVHILGGGSNTVFADSGFAGVVVKINLKGVKFEENGLVKAAAGEDWDELVGECVERDLAGLTCLSGVPGSVGAAPVQNVGAYGQQVADAIVEVEVLDREEITQAKFSNRDCGFSYRTSRFKGKDAGRYIITAVTFQLRPGGEEKLQYEELITRVGNEKDLQKVRETVLALRGGKAMLAESRLRSCGSFFTNAIITSDKLAELQENYEVPHFADGEKVKIPAGWLVEQAGFEKGWRRGGVGISPNHALALVNYDGTTQELLTLAQGIQEAVKQKFGIELEREPVVVD